MIKFDSVSKSFNSAQKVALKDVSFVVDPGEFVFVTGHSGSGKTTLLKLLLREYQPTQGRILFEDQDLKKLSAGKVAKHRRQIGVIFQDYQLLDDLTVWENIALPLVIAKQNKKEINSRIEELLKLLNLTGYERAFPAQLSGGEAQRIGVARALAIAPKIIFADEPTGNLDQENSLAILNLLKNINQYGTTVIFATHNLELLNHGSQARHLKFQTGELVHDSKPKKVEKKNIDNENQEQSKEEEVLETKQAEES